MVRTPTKRNLLSFLQTTDVAQILFLTLVFWIVVGNGNALAQVIVHVPYAYSEDGDAVRDGDKVQNGVLVWRGGVVHVVSNNFNVVGPYNFATNQYGRIVLKIEPGAIVKIAGTFVMNSSGVVESWLPPDQTTIYANDSSSIQIEGATITEIRDDTGGDTNQDGAVSVPNPAFPGYKIRFGGRPDEYIRNSVVKYAYRLRHLGSMEIDKNQFLQLGRIGSSVIAEGYNHEIVPGAATRITNNTFDFWWSNFTAAPGAVDLRGASPTVEKNVFKGAGTALFIGPTWTDGWHTDIAPKSGKTIIYDNTIETSRGIFLEPEGDTTLARLNYVAEIRQNRIRSGSGVGDYGLRLAMAAQVNVSDNEISNFQMPMLVNTGVPVSFLKNGLATNGLRINNNKFSTEGVTQSIGTVPESLWTKIYVDAKSNYWGDPSGPRDDSKADSLYNPNGSGVRIGNGFDYQPFVGGGMPAQKNRIHITAVSQPLQPLKPETSAQITVVVDDYALGSTTDGRINIIVRDASGARIEPLTVTMQVTSGNHSIAFSPFAVPIPRFTTVVYVEAELVPDGAGEVASSNAVMFPVVQPGNSFEITCVEDPAVGLCLPPLPIRGNLVKANVTFRYTFVSGPVHAQAQIVERARGSKTVLKSFPPIVFTGSPAVDAEITKYVELDLPLRDVLLEPRSELYVTYAATDDAGNVLGEGNRVQPFFEDANLARYAYPRVGNQELRNYPPVVPMSPSRQPRTYMIAGELPSYIVTFRTKILTKNVTNWQVRVGDDRALDASGNILYTYTAAGSALDNAFSNIDSLKSVRVDGQNVIPPGTRIFRTFVRLVAPDLSNMTVAVDSFDIPVTDPPLRSVQLDLPAGPSTADFNPVPVSLNLASNQTAGSATALEFDGPYGGTSLRVKPQGRSISEVDDFYWTFVPLNRYWSLIDTLREGAFSATLQITYDPLTDFPGTPGFLEDSLIIAGRNVLSGELEPLPSTLDMQSHSLTVPYTKFYDTYVPASRTTTIISSVLTGPETLPVRLQLKQNYPNPFNPITTFEFHVPKSGFVTMKMYDIRGVEAATIVEGYLPAGVHTRTWNTGGLASGIYFCRLWSGEFTDVKKTVLLK